MLPCHGTAQPHKTDCYCLSRERDDLDHIFLLPETRSLELGCLTLQPHLLSFTFSLTIIVFEF